MVDGSQVGDWGGLSPPAGTRGRVPWLLFLGLGERRPGKARARGGLENLGPRSGSQFAPELCTDELPWGRTLKVIKGTGL